MSLDGLKKTSNSFEETLSIGLEIATLVPKGTPVCLYGELGAGKTSLSKGIISGWIEISPHEIQSPTFSLLHIYNDEVYHLDCYRLKGEMDFLARGLDESFEHYCVIEWPEKIPSLIPKKRCEIRIESLGEEIRQFTIFHF